MKTELVAILNGPGWGNWQGACENRKTGEWFLAHSKRRPDADGYGEDDENLILYRFAKPAADKTCRPLDRCTLVHGAHCYGFGVGDTNVVWASHEPSNEVVTLRYQPAQATRRNTH